MTKVLIADLRLGQSIHLGPGPYMTATVNHIDPWQGIVTVTRPYCHIGQITNVYGIAYTGIEVMTYFTGSADCDPSTEKLEVYPGCSDFLGDSINTHRDKQSQKAGS